MIAYSFHSREPANHGRAYLQTLFHLPDHLALQKKAGWKSFYVLHDKSRILFAEVHFCVNAPLASSPLRAPFGSFLFSDNLPPEVLYNFILFAEDELKKDFVSNIFIKLPPAVYFPGQHHVLMPVLLTLQYTIQQAEISSVIDVTEKPFTEIIDAWEKRKIRQAREAELVSRIVHTDNLEMVYEFIFSCRQQKGYSLSMTYPEVKALTEKFPDRIVLMGVFDQDNLVAAAITIRVTDQVLYNFYSDHQAGYDHLSPAVMLIESAYGYCQHHRLGLLDLGTSSLDSKLNFTLLDFKSRLGGKPSPKYQLSKTI